MRTALFPTALALAAMLAAGGVATAQNNNRNNEQDRDQQRMREADLQQMNFHRFTQLRDLQVQTQDGQNAGTIQNLAVRPLSGEIEYVIVRGAGEEVGRFNRAVPLKALTFRDRERAARLNIAADRWRNAPPFEEAGWHTIGDQRWGRIVHQHYNIPFVEDREIDRQFSQPGDRAPGDPAPQDMIVLIPATDLLRMDLTNQERQRLGSTQDLVMEISNGYMIYALIRPVEGNNDDLVVVPWQALHPRVQERVLVLDKDRDDFKEAPKFTRLQDLRTRQFTQQVAQFYELQPDVVLGFVPAEGVRVGGWEHRSAYNRLFDTDEIETMEGRVTAIERFTPMQGMSEGVRMRLRTEDGRTMHVHLGPAWYIERQDLRFREGDNVSVRGASVQVEGQNVVMAQTVRRGNQVLLLRDQEGLPRWAATYRADEVEDHLDD